MRPYATLRGGIVVDIDEMEEQGAEYLAPTSVDEALLGVGQPDRDE